MNVNAPYIGRIWSPELAFGAEIAAFPMADTKKEQKLSKNRKKTAKKMARVVVAAQVQDATEWEKGF